MNIIKHLLLLVIIAFISNKGYGQDYKKRLVDSAQIVLVDTAPLGLATGDEGIPVYLAELRIKGKVFDVRPVSAAMSLSNKGYTYNLEDLFSYNNIPKSLFTDAEIVELISKYKWELDEDVLKVDITKYVTSSPLARSSELPSYVEFKIKKLLFK